MNTDRAFASGTGPSYIFILYKFPNTIIPDIFKIFNHAHIIFGSISFIQMFQIYAGEISAFKTELRPTFSKYFAVLDFTSDTGDRFIGVRSFTAGAIIYFSQIKPCKYRSSFRRGL
jgi:hypothetical protein